MGNNNFSRLHALASELERLLPAPQPVPSNPSEEPSAPTKKQQLQELVHQTKAQLRKEVQFSQEAPYVSIIIPVFNKASFTLACLDSLARHQTQYAFEVIIIDNASSDATAHIISSVDGIRYIRNKTNTGFVEACNKGADLAKGEVLVFLNNDTLVQDGWLDNLVGPLEDESIGLVGSKLIYPDGSLQEAGGVIFSDASGHNYGKHRSSGDFAFNFRRDVDYCSGASIAIATEYFKKLGMFDMRYAPAYYEDTDLAMKVHKSGKRVVYEPASVLVHIEGGTSGTDITSGFKRYQAINHKKFLKKWTKELAANHSAPGTNIEIARHYGKKPKQLLVVDSIVPEANRDSGSLRMTKILESGIKLGYKVTLIADNLVATLPYTSDLQRLGVEVVYGADVNIRKFYAERQDMYDAVILSRPLTVAWHIDLARAFQTKAKIFYDTVDLHYLRVGRNAELEKNKALAKEATLWKELEFSLMDESDVTLVVSTAEKELLAKSKPSTKVKIISNINPSQTGVENTPSFDDRSGLLFIGSSHPPNEDAMVWFVKKILPIIQKSLPGIELTILGSNPSKTLLDLQSNTVTVPGFIDDVSPYFHNARLFVSPLRFGAGVKGKITQAISFGLPIVGTDMSVEGTNMNPGVDCLTAETATDFAAAVVKLYTDQKLWEKTQKHELKTYNDYFSEEAGLAALKDALS